MTNTLHRACDHAGEGSSMVTMSVGATVVVLAIILDHFGVIELD